ncbi:MAG TPA: hypothetical protein VL282_17250 [Tepidisphaeraceae bacterium]|jgi:MYXO-CTERM domain-containing protein|nr:hypothetical protein [Tepidisphaeraceae bacterium]
MRGTAIALAGVIALISQPSFGTETFTKVADTATAAPGESGTLSQFHTAELSGNNLTFLAFFSGGFGTYTAKVSPNGVFKLIDTGDTVPGHGAVGGLGNNSGISGNDVAVLVLSGVNGIYHGTVGSAGITKIVESNVNAPGTTSPFTTFFNPFVSGNNAAFKGYYNNSNSQGIYTATLAGTGLAKVVDFSNTVPGQSNFTQLESPTISGNNIVFWGKGTTDGIYAGTLGAIGASKIADHTDIVNGHSFTAFNNAPDVSGNMVAFQGVFSGNSGVYSATIGTSGITKIAEAGDTAPGVGTFTAVQDPVTNGRDVAFIGNHKVAGVGRSGLWIEHDGTITPVIDYGNSLFGSTISSLSMGNACFDGYRLAFNYSLANGTNGIAVVDLPEPGMAGLLALGAFLTLRRRSRQPKK